MSEAADRSLLDRLWGALSDLRAGASSLVDRGKVPPSLPLASQEGVKKRILDCVFAPGGDYARRARTADLGRVYLNLDDEGRPRFLRLLAQTLAIDTIGASGAIDDWHEALKHDGDSGPALAAAKRVRDKLTPPWLMLLTQFNALPEGVKFLVDLREDLLKIRKESSALSALDADLRDLLASWFDLGFLDLEQITWHSSAALLEKLIDYEAVHEISSWEDLRNRLESDRRCFALFHPRMPDEPLAFVEVALVTGLAGNVQALLDISAPTDDPQKADTAIFYSISNTQKGLQGISFGEHLIKKAVDDLSHRLPNLKQFATLSPVPGFRKWLDGLAGGHMEEVFANGDAEIYQEMQRHGWAENVSRRDDFADFLTRMAGWYFAQKRKDGTPIDPVARFHLRNGARLERINWPADLSDNGLKQAYGLMVNYRYEPAHLEDNHERYTQGEGFAVSKQVRDMVKKARPLNRGTKTSQDTDIAAVAAEK